MTEHDPPCSRAVQPDHRLILSLVTPESTVLDLGCGNGDLLLLLEQEKGVKGQGVEIDDKAVFECVGKGLSVFHDDIDSGLADYPDKSFDFVILNQSLQQVRKPDTVVHEALRVGQKAIIGFPNFAYVRARLQISFGGRAPVTPSLPYEWHDTPNLHFLSILDFRNYCRKKNIIIEQAGFIGTKRRVPLLPNLFAHIGIFLISKDQGLSRSA